MFDYKENGSPVLEAAQLPERWEIDGAEVQLRQLHKTGADYSHTNWFERAKVDKPPYHPHLQKLVTIGVNDGAGTKEQHSVIDNDLADAKVSAYGLLHSQESELLRSVAGDESLEVHLSRIPKVVELYFSRANDEINLNLPDSFFIELSKEATERGITLTEMRDLVGSKFDVLIPLIAKGAALRSAIEAQIEAATSVTELIGILVAADAAADQFRS